MLRRSARPCGTSWNCRAAGTPRRSRPGGTSWGDGTGRSRGCSRSARPIRNGGLACSAARRLFERHLPVHLQPRRKAGLGDVSRRDDHHEQLLSDMQQHARTGAGAVHEVAEHFGRRLWPESARCRPPHNDFRAHIATRKRLAIAILITEYSRRGRRGWRGARARMYGRAPRYPNNPHRLPVEAVLNKSGKRRLNGQQPRAR
jgi:hypothetical protein